MNLSIISIVGALFIGVLAYISRLKKKVDEAEIKKIYDESYKSVSDKSLDSLIDDSNKRLHGANGKDN